MLSLISIIGETLIAVVARLVEIVLVLPSRMCLGHTVEERLGTDDVEVFTALLSKYYSTGYKDTKKF